MELVVLRSFGKAICRKGMLWSCGTFYLDVRHGEVGRWRKEKKYPATGELRCWGWGWLDVKGIEMRLEVASRASKYFSRLGTGHVSTENATNES